MPNLPQVQDQLVKAVYQFAADLLANGVSPTLIEERLLDRGLDSESAYTVVSKLLRAMADDAKYSDYRRPRRRVQPVQPVRYDSQAAVPCPKCGTQVALTNAMGVEYEVCPGCGEFIESAQVVVPVLEPDTMARAEPVARLDRLFLLSQDR